MKLAWLTDIHLNFIDYDARLKFYNEITQKSCDAVLISGDIAERVALTKLIVLLPKYCEGLVVEFDRLLVITQVGIKPAEIIELDCLAVVVSKLCVQCLRLSIQVQCPLVLTHIPISVTQTVKNCRHTTFIIHVLSNGKRLIAELNRLCVFTDILVNHADIIQEGSLLGAVTDIL